MTEQPLPTLHEIIAARPNVYRYLKPTPLYPYPGLTAPLPHTHNLAEGAGSASLAAALKRRDRLVGKNVVLVMSGGNLSSL